LGERPSSPTHEGEPNNINNTTNTTEPNVLGAAPLFASVRPRLELTTEEYNDPYLFDKPSDYSFDELFDALNRKTREMGLMFQTRDPDYLPTDEDFRLFIASRKVLDQV
jgi:hypothetical protein